MIDHLVRELQVLQKSDFLIAKIWLTLLARRFGLIAFACLIAMFGLGMANIAGFYAFEASLGPIWAATVVALVDLGIAGIVLLVASKSRPGPELDLAFDVRKMAVEPIQGDARDLKLTLDGLVDELKKLRTNITQLVQNPLDVAAQKLLIPAALSVLRGVRSKKEHT